MAAANTWGISGPTFLVIYGGLFALVVLICVAVRWVVLRRLPSAAPGELHPVDLAFLREGKGLAVLVAWLDLRRQGVVTVVGEDELLDRDHSRRDLKDLPSSAEIVVGPVPPGAHPLERVVAEEMEGSFTSAVLTRARIERSPVFAEMTGSLETRGYLVDGATLGRIRRAALWFVPLLVLGLVRLLAGLANGKPVLYLAGFMVGTLVAMVLAVRQQLRRTPAGDKAVKAAQERVAGAKAVVPKLKTVKGKKRIGSTNPVVHTVAADPAVVAAAGFTVAWLGVPALAATFGFMPVFTRLGAVPDRGGGWGGGMGSSCGGGCGGGSSCGGGGCGGGGCGG
jgi:uncharacterized protein (TIGR04222 family)